MNTKFIEEIVEEWVSLGLAERINGTSLGSLEGDTVVELEAIEKGEENQGVVVYVDGTEQYRGLYDDANFVDSLSSTLRIALSA